MEMVRCQQYINALEEERRKIEVFQRELPLCLQLITQAIESCRQQLAAEITSGRSESEETSSEGPVLEEFIPIKKDSDSTEKQNQMEHDKDDESNDKDEKPDWLRSVQLWNQDSQASSKVLIKCLRSLWDIGRIHNQIKPFSLTKDADSCQKPFSLENKKRGAFQPFCKEKRPPPSVTCAAAVSAPTVGVAASSTSRGDEKQEQPQKKTRRCWSPELHNRFLHALQKLGGSHSATPKQIREFMKVDGLTNDEVKSHLQKYRLHTRRAPSTSIPVSNPQPPQFVVVGGIWVPQDCSAVASFAQVSVSEAAPTTIYAPLATTPSPLVAKAPSVPTLVLKLKEQRQQQSLDRPLSSSDRRGGDKSRSPDEDSIGEVASSSATSS